MDDSELFTIDRKGLKNANDAARKSKKRKGATEKIVDKEHTVTNALDQPEFDREEQALEHLLFGSASIDAELFHEPKTEPKTHKKFSKTSKKIERGEAEKPKEPVWNDDDDEECSVEIYSVDRLKKLRKSEDETALDGKEYSSRLRNQFSKLNPAVSWATRKSADDLDDDAGRRLLQSTSGLLGKGHKIPESILEIERLKDANIADVSDAVIQSVRFHPTSQLLLCAGLDKRLKIFQVDGKTNAKVQSVFFEDLPIRTAEFSADGSEIFLSGRRKFFYVFDLAAANIKKVSGILGRSEKSSSSLYVSPDNSNLVVLGNCGHISVLSRRTKQWVADLKMNHDARAAAFSPDGRFLFSAGSGGLVYQWDLRMRKCMRKIVDEGSINISSLGISSDGEQLAVGSHSGVVNTYDMHALNSLSIGPAGTVQAAPRRSIMNLTTQITDTRFSPDGQLLAIASNFKKQALKMVHAGAGSVFSNWPTASTPLNHVSSLDFSPSGGMLAMGNDRGKVLLYRLKHYTA